MSIWSEQMAQKTPEQRLQASEAELAVDVAERFILAAERKVAKLDIEGLAHLAKLRSTVDGALHRAVTQLRTEEGGGYSWTDVGRVLGITRQGAEQRFGR